MSQPTAHKGHAQGHRRLRPAALAPSPIRISTPPVKIIGFEPRYRSGFRLSDR